MSVEVTLWHIVAAERIATIDNIEVHRTTHIPLGMQYEELDRPERRTSLNIWQDPSVPLPEGILQRVRELCGQDDPIWIGWPLCCKQPSFWGIEGETEVLE